MLSSIVTRDVLHGKDRSGHYEGCNGGGGEYPLPIVSGDRQRRFELAV